MAGSMFEAMVATPDGPARLRVPDAACGSLDAGERARSIAEAAQAAVVHREYCVESIGSDQSRAAFVRSKMRLYPVISLRPLAEDDVRVKGVRRARAAVAPLDAADVEIARLWSEARSRVPPRADDLDDVIAALRESVPEPLAMGM